MASKEKERKILRRFIEVYCHKHCGSGRGELCTDCADLWDYASDRLAQCPFDPKPKCKECSVHCYAPEYRKRIQEVMKFSGIHFVKRGRVDWLVKYFLANR